MHIPEEAVKAAARLISTVDYPRHEDDPEFAKAVLEAAAPYISELAWAEGHDEACHGTPIEANPYSQ